MPSLYLRPLFFAWSLMWSLLTFAAPPLPHQAPAVSQGNINCASSTCHGSITPWHDTNVLQNEYTTWSMYDKHSQAYKVLFNDESKRIVKNLGLKQPAHEANLCLDCHAHNPQPKLRGERFLMSEGVSCEGCHGPSEKWLKSHTVPGVTHAQNVANGLYPTSNPVAQAKLCNSCHVGDESRFVTHRIMGAGHPRMSFELNTFIKIEPPHYRIDSDYIMRKGNVQPIRSWAVGQLMTAKSMLDTLADSKRNHDGIFPELVLFDCHACHHPMSNKRWSSRNALPPGVVRLNDSSLLMVQAILQATDAAAAKQFSTLNMQLQIATTGNTTKGSQAAFSRVEETAKNLSKLVTELLPKIEKSNLDQSKLQDIFMVLVKTGPSYTDYAGAEQAYMAIANVGNLMLESSPGGASEQLKKSIDRLKKELANEDTFAHKNFVEEYSKLGQLMQDKNGRK